MIFPRIRIQILFSLAIIKVIYHCSYVRREASIISMWRPVRQIFWQGSAYLFFFGNGLTVWSDIVRIYNLLGSRHQVTAFNQSRSAQPSITAAIIPMTCAGVHCKHYSMGDTLKTFCNFALSCTWAMKGRAVLLLELDIHSHSHLPALQLVIAVGFVVQCIRKRLTDCTSASITR